jgi:hypothetical protein
MKKKFYYLVAFMLMEHLFCKIILTVISINKITYEIELIKTLTRFELENTNSEVDCC